VQDTWQYLLLNILNHFLPCLGLFRCVLRKEWSQISRLDFWPHWNVTDALQVTAKHIGHLMSHLLELLFTDWVLVCVFGASSVPRL